MAFMETLQKLFTWGGMDNQMTYCILLVSNHSKDVVKLVSICEFAVLNAIKLCKPGLPFYEIGNSIEYACFNVFTLLII
jgi:hypothetical protein